MQSATKTANLQFLAFGCSAFTQGNGFHRTTGWYSNKSLNYRAFCGGESSMASLNNATSGNHRPQVKTMLFMYYDSVAIGNHSCSSRPGFFLLRSWWAKVPGSRALISRTRVAQSIFKHMNMIFISAWKLQEIMITFLTIW